MKRFHVHVHVEDLAKSVVFYTKLFGAEPTRQEGDYARWMIEDPAVNFAISTRGDKPGVDHLGIQTDAPEELDALKARAEAADMALFDVAETTCCYARSDKYWVTDPQGVAWEHFHTLDSVPVFSERKTEAASDSACCAPKTTRGKALGYLRQVFRVLLSQHEKPKTCRPFARASRPLRPCVGVPIISAKAASIQQ